MGDGHDRSKEPFATQALGESRSDIVPLCLAESLE